MISVTAQYGMQLFVSEKIMYKILKKKMLGSQIVLMDIEAPRVAKASLPGQFVIVIMDEKGERIPLTVCDYDIKKGTVTIVFQTVGDTTRRMAGFREGDSFFAFTGPLGHPSDFVKEPLEEVKKKKFIFIGGGVGVAPQQRLRQGYVLLAPGVAAFLQI